ncbi:hypothetical protein FOL47_001909, partial [Perkinsus chesapeaki]
DHAWIRIRIPAQIVDHNLPCPALHYDTNRFADELKAGENQQRLIFGLQLWGGESPRFDPEWTNVAWGEFGYTAARIILVSLLIEPDEVVNVEFVTKWVEVKEEIVWAM